MVLTAHFKLRERYFLPTVFLLVKVLSDDFDWPENFDRALTSPRVQHDATEHGSLEAMTENLYTSFLPRAVHALTPLSLPSFLKRISAAT